MYKFWMVLVDGTHSTSYKHSSLDSARTEAEWLIRTHTDNYGKGVTILEAVEYVNITYPPVEWETIDAGMYKGDEIK